MKKFLVIAFMLLGFVSNVNAGTAPVPYYWDILGIASTQAVDSSGNSHAGIWEKPFHKGLLLLHVFNKLISLKLYSLFSKSKKSTLTEWEIVFQKRHEWLRGYR